jgi:hypothetical protein
MNHNKITSGFKAKNLFLDLVLLLMAENGRFWVFGLFMYPFVVEN